MKVFSSSAVPENLKAKLAKLDKLFKLKNFSLEKALKETQIVEAVKDVDLPLVEITVERNSCYHRVWLDPGNGKTYCSCPIYRKLKMCHHSLKVALLFEIRKLRWKTVST
jgi:hypothetical protein